MMGSQAITILIIDDDEVIRQSYSDYLEDRDYRVLTAANGTAGLELLDSGEPDLVIIDLQMSGMSGLDVLQAISESGSDIPRLVVSGTGEIRDVVQALRYGAWDYLFKPVSDLVVLEHAISKSVERARLIRENQEYQEHLEELVQKRTEELDRANIHQQQMNSRLKQVVRTMRDLSGFSDVAGFGKILLERFASHLGASSGSLYLTREGGLKLLHSLDEKQAADFIPFPLAENTVFRVVMEKKEPLLVSDIETSEDIVTSGWHGYSSGSLIVFPLLDTGHPPVGIIILHSCSSCSFMDEDREIGSILASNSCAILRAIHAYEMLRESESRFRAVFENSPAGMVILDRNLIFQTVNSTITQFSGYAKEEIIGVRFHDLMPDIAQSLSAKLEDVFITGIPLHNLEGHYQTQRGETRSWLGNFFLLGEVGSGLVVAVLIDITERKKTADDIRQALEEKEVLLKELYHRTKNNMQVIVSLMDIQESFLQTTDEIDLLHDIRNRVNAMALVHKKLYQTGDLSSLSLNGYLHDLIMYLKSGVDALEGEIRMDLQLERIVTLVDIAIPCGLVLNELLTNIIRHAFPENRSGKICIRLSQNDSELELFIRDNGVGFPEDYDPKNDQKMGLQTVYLLVEHQLKGRVEVDYDAGVTYRIYFKNDLYVVRI